jgi:hypothetical protein
LVRHQQRLRARTNTHHHTTHHRTNRSLHDAPQYTPAIA